MAKERQYNESTAFDKIVSLLNYKDRSCAYVRDRLLLDGWSEHDVQAAIDRAIELGFLNDKRYAESLYRSKMASGFGVEGIRRELEKSGLELDIESDELVKDSEELPEEDRAYDFLCKHPPHSKNLRDGAFRKLISKGYSVGVASSVARRWSEHADNTF